MSEPSQPLLPQSHDGGRCEGGDGWDCSTVVDGAYQRRERPRGSHMSSTELNTHPNSSFVDRIDGTNGTAAIHDDDDDDDADALDIDENTDAVLVDHGTARPSKGAPAEPPQQRRSSTTYMLRRRARDVDDSGSDYDAPATNERTLRRNLEDDSRKKETAAKTRLTSAAAQGIAPDSPGVAVRASNASRTTAHPTDESTASIGSSAETEEDDVEEEAQYDEDGDGALTVLLFAVGSCATYWLPVVWVMAACWEPAVFGLLYVSFFVWTCLSPGVTRRVATVTRVRDGIRSRLVVSFTLVPSMWMLLASLATSVAGLCATGVHAIWWCQQEHTTAHPDNSNASSSSSSSDASDAWATIWPVLGFYAGTDASACSGSADLGRHAWIHIVLCVGSSLALVAGRLQRKDPTRMQRHTVLVDWTPTGAMLLAMNIAGCWWVSWAVSMMAMMLRPALVHVPLLGACVTFVIWAEAFVVLPLRDVPWALHMENVARRASNASNTAWRCAQTFVAMLTWVYFAACALTSMGYALGHMDPPAMHYLTSIDHREAEGTVQLALAGVLLYSLSVIRAVQQLDDARSRSGCALDGDLSIARCLPRPLTSCWGARTSPILHSLHRFVHYSWYVVNAVLLFCLVNTAPSALGLLWLLMWVYCLWGGGGQRIHIMLAAATLAQFVGVFVADMQIYTPELDHANREKHHATVVIGVRPYQQHAVVLSSWLVSVLLYNLCVLRYRRHLQSRERALRGSFPRGSSVMAAEESEHRPLSSPISGRASPRGHMSYGTDGSSVPPRLRSSTVASYIMDMPQLEGEAEDNDGARSAFDNHREHTTTTPSKAPRKRQQPVATTGHMPPAAPSSSSHRRLIRHHSLVKIAVTTTETFAIRVFHVFSELVRQYFFLVALMAIFVAAVVRVNTLHVAFLVLFVACLLRKEFSIFAWGLVVLYSVAVLLAQYAVVAFVNNKDPNLVQAGFSSNNGWELWPYYLLAAIFLFQFRLYAITSIAELSDNVRRYLELAERVTIELIVWLNVVFFGVLACMSHATVFAFIYIGIFFTALVVFLEATSLHTPSLQLSVFWYTVCALNALCSVSVYCYQLFPEAAETMFGSWMRSIGLTLQDAGIADKSIAALWPKIASLLLCLVQARAWYARRGRHQRRLAGAIDATGSPSEQLDDDDDGVYRRPTAASEFSWSRNVFSSIMLAASTVAVLLSLYSLPIAVLALFFGAAFGASTADAPSWGGQSSMVQLLYFLAASCMTALPVALKVIPLWRVVQCVSGAATITAFVLQLPGFPDAWATSPWGPFLLVAVDCATHTMQWFVVLPHLMVFVTSALHASFAAKARRLGASHLANAAGTTTGDSSTSDAAGSSRWRAIIFHPAQHVRFFSFHATSGMLFINACVRRSTLFGIAFFGIFAAVAMIGKTGMGQSHRWTVLVFVVLVVMCVQYALHLRPPPQQQASDSSIAAYLNEWMIDVHAGRAGWSAAHAELVHYFELQTATDDIMLTMGLWCAVALHYVGLQAYHAVPGRTEREAAKVRGKLTVTERLKKTEAISLARRHGAMEFFKRLLPLPEGRRDFTRSSSRSIGDAVQLIAYKRSPLLVLVAMFLHALYDGTTDLSVFKILSLLLVLAFLQNVHRLPWRGNCWWRYLAAFHGVWFGLRLVLFIPGIVRTQWMLCGFQVLGVLPHRNLVNDASSMLSITSGTHCPGAPYTLVEFALQAAVLTLAVAQYAAFEKSDFIFVLHHLHQQDVFSKCLGEAIRQTRRQLLLDAKRQQTEEMDHMFLQIERIQEARELRRQQRSGVDDGGNKSAEIADEVHRNDTVHFGADENVQASPHPQAPASSGAFQVAMPELSPLHVHDDDDGFQDDDHSLENTSLTGGDIDLRHLLERTLDKRSLELLGNVTTDNSASHARRMERTFRSRMAGVGGAQQPRTRDGGGDPPSTGDAAQHARSSTDRPLGMVEGSTKDVPPPPPTAAASNNATAPTGAVGALPTDGLEHSLPRASHRRSQRSTNAEDEAVVKKPSLVAVARATFLSVLDKAILWLDRHSVGAGVVRLDSHMLPGHRTQYLLVGCYRCIFSFTHLLSYFLYCLQFALAPCVLNAVLPVSVFGYAAMMNPRPHRGYWRLCLVYIQLTILIKCLVRIGYCEPNLVEEDGRSVQLQAPVYDASWLYARTCTSDFFLVDVLLGLICVLVTISHTAYLRSWGLWNDVELLSRPAPTPAGAGPIRTSTNDAGFGSPDESSSSIFVNKSSRSHANQGTSISDVLTSAAYNLRRDDVKLGTDVYRFGFACELLVVVMLFFGYYNLVGSEDSLVNSLMNSLLPGTLAVLILALFSFIVIDRIVYLRRVILGNVVLNVVFALFYHGAMIWWFLHQTNFVRTYLRDDSFGVRGSLGLAVVLYLLKCGYLMSNAVQISRGLAPCATHIAFTGSYSSPEFIMYMASRLMPFVFDMRVILDWAVVPTALKLPYWMKLEDVAHELYSLMCDKEDTRVALDMNKNERNAPYPGLFRNGVGWALFLLLTAVLMFPLFLYSSFSPVLQQNWVESCTCTLALEGSPPLWSSASMLPRNGVSIGADGVPFRLNGTVRELLERVRPSLVSTGLTTDVTQQLPLNQYSNTLWAVSPPTLQDMLQALSSAGSIALLLTITIRNHVSVDVASKSNSITQQVPLTAATRGNLSALLSGKQNASVLPRLYTPFLVNRQSGSTSLTTSGASDGPSDSDAIDCVLLSSVNSSMNNGSSQVLPTTSYFSLKCRTVFQMTNVFPGSWTLSPDEHECFQRDVCPNYENTQLWNQSRFALANPTIVVDSSAVLGASFLQTIGLVAAYTTFVLAIGRVLRFATTGSAFRTALEDLDDAEYMLILLELILLARSKCEFEMEADLYSEMIYLIKLDEDRHTSVVVQRLTDA